MDGEVPEASSSGFLMTGAKPSASAWWMDGLVALAGVLFTAGLVWADVFNDRARAREEFERSADARAVTFQSECQARIEFHDSFSAFFHHADTVTEEEFARFASVRSATNRTVIGFVPRVKAPDRARFEAELRGAHPDFPIIWESGAREELVPAPPRPDYFPVRYLASSSERGAVYGFDLASEPVRRAALEKAAATGQPAMTDAIRLVRDDEEWGFVRFIPVYTRGASVGTPEERREALRGLVIAVYRYRDLLGGLLVNGRSADEHILLFSSDDGSSRPVWARRDRNRPGDTSVDASLSEVLRRGGAVVRSTAVSDRTMVLAFLPTARGAWIRPGGIGTVAILLLGLGLTAGVVADRRRSRRALEAMAEIEARTSLVFDSANDAVLVVDERGQIVLTNARATPLFGFTRQELVGQPVEVLVPERLRGRHLLHRSALLADAESTRADHRSGELPVRRKDGAEFPAEITLSRVDFGGSRSVIATVRDVTERQRQETIRRLEFEVTRILSDSSTLAEAAPLVLMALASGLGWDYGELCLVDEAGRFVRPFGTWHDGTEALVRFEETGRAGTRLDEDVALQSLLAVGQPIWTGDVKPTSEKNRRMLASGLRSGVAVPFVVQGRPFGFLTLLGRRPRLPEPGLLAILSDVGSQVGQFVARTKAQEDLAVERNSLARKVDERTAELSRLNAELERASRMKDEFLASMSHELRTPLNAVLGMAEALQERVFGTLNERQTRSLRVIVDSGRHLLALINDILDVSKVEAGKVALEPATHAVAPLLDAALHIVWSAAEKKGLAVEPSVVPPGLEVRVDARRLKQILVNLLSNAVKFTPTGGTIGVEATGDDDDVRIVVWDTGVGIATEDLPRLFRPFSQLDSSLSRSHEGTGLGLVLVRKLAELHGGAVDLESEPGRGTRVTVTLPRHGPAFAGGDEGDGRNGRIGERGSKGDGLEPARDAGLGVLQACRVGLGPLILLAEDNEANLETLVAYLEGAGFRVAVARDGEEAEARARELRPALVLMDIQMPKVDGLEATRRLRAAPETKDLPIVALTALAMAGDRERCLAAGADEYLSKPLRLPFVVETIRRLLPRAFPPAGPAQPVPPPSPTEEGEWDGGRTAPDENGSAEVTHDPS